MQEEIITTARLRSFCTWVATTSRPRVLGRLDWVGDILEAGGDSPAGHGSHRRISAEAGATLHFIIAATPRISVS